MARESGDGYQCCKPVVAAGSRTLQGVNGVRMRGVIGWSCIWVRKRVRLVISKVAKLTVADNPPKLAPAARRVVVSVPVRIDVVFVSALGHR